jgi:hypothetical protein
MTRFSILKHIFSIQKRNKLRQYQGSGSKRVEELC